MATLTPTLANLRKIVDEKQAARFRWSDETGKGMLVDLFSASAVVATYDKASDETKAKIEAALTKSRAHFVRLVTLILK